MCSVVSDSLQPHGLEPTRLLSPWDVTGNNTGVDCYSFLQEISIQGRNPHLLCLPHWPTVSLSLVPAGKPDVWYRRGHGLLYNSLFREFPGSSVVRSVFPVQGAQVWSLVGELRSDKAHGAAKIKKKHTHKKNTFFEVNTYCLEVSKAKNLTTYYDILNTERLVI